MKKQKIQKLGIELVGLDIGYGMTKAVTLGQDPIAFPSVWGHAMEITHDWAHISSIHPGDQLSDDEADWFFGNLAIDQLKVAQMRRLRGRTAADDSLGNAARIRLMKVALGKLYPNTRDGEVIHLEIATGLPVDHMRGAAALKSVLIGQHKIDTDLTHFIANITQVYVMPQPYGTIYGEAITSLGEPNPCHKQLITGTVDIGTFTTDVTLDNNGQYIGTASGSVEIGVSAIHDYISNAFERQFQQKLSLAAIETILTTGCFVVFGKSHDFTGVVEEAIQPLRDGVLNLMNDLWQNGATVDTIFISGGGARYVGQDIINAYPQSRVVDNPAYANAIGYLNFALFRRVHPAE